jgi:MFS family permease
LGYIDKLRDSLSLRGNIPGLVASGLIEGTAWQMHELVWPPYIISLGGSMATIGGMQSLWTLVTNGLQFITGELCDSWGRKTVITGYYLASIAGLVISIYARDWRWLVLVIVLYSIADSLGEPSFYPIYAESVDANKIGLSISLLSLTWFLPGLYSKLIAGYIGDNVGLVNVIRLVLVGEVVATLVFFFGVQETLKKRRPMDWAAVKRNIVGVIKPRGDLRDVYLLSILDRFSWNINRGIFVAMLYESLGLSLLQTGVLITVAVATTSLALIPVGNLVDRYGSPIFLRASVLLAIVSFSGYVFFTSFPVLLVIQVFRGLAMGLWDTSYNSFLAKAVPEQERGSLYGSINGLRGIIVFPAPLLGAYLFEGFGLRGTFAASIAVSSIALIIALRLRDK